MKKEEKIYIMNQCAQCLQIAINTQFTDPYKFFMNIGAGRKLKRIIEEFIDCQSKPYYDIYLYIVKLYNQLDHIAD